MDRGPSKAGVRPTPWEPGSSPRAGDAIEWRLPRGPHKLPREVVEANRRERLLIAAGRALAEHGYAGMSVEHVLSVAGVSRSTFYEHFENKQQCLLVAHEAASQRFAAALFRVCAVEAEWAGKVAAAVSQAIGFAVERPEEARLLLIDAVAAEPALVDRVLAFNEFLAGILRNRRDHCPRAASLPELTEPALVGAAGSVIGNCLLCGEAALLPGLEPQLVQLVLMPYLGVEEARAVANGNR